MDKYKTLCKMGSVTLRGMEIYLNEMIGKGVMAKENTIDDLLKLCEEFNKWEVEQYENSKLEQGYCCNRSIPLE